MDRGRRKAGLPKRREPPKNELGNKGKSTYRIILQAVTLLAAFLISFSSIRGLRVHASGDGASFVEITATLEKSTVSGNKPKPKPPGGDDDHHHHDDDDDDTPSPKPKEEKKPTPELPVVPVVYLPGPGVTKVKAVPVPGEKILKTVTETVTGNETILPEPRLPMRLSVSGNVTQEDEKDRAVDKLPEISRDHSEELEKDHFIVWVIWLLVVLLFFVLAAWLLAIRHKSRRESADIPERIEDEEEEEVRLEEKKLS